MKLSWYGTASLILEEAGVRMAFDPFGGIAPGELKNPPEQLPYEEQFRNVNRVYVTHGHFDHLIHLPRLYGGTDIPIYCTEAPEHTLLRHGMQPYQLRRIGPGYEETVGPFRVRAFHSRHCRFDLPQLKKTVRSPDFFRDMEHLNALLKADVTYPELGQILLYQVEAGGKRVQILGSMNLAPQEDYPTGAEALVLPLQGRSDQDTYALELVRRLKPGAVYLDHYDNSFPPITGAVDPGGFVDNVVRTFHIPCLPLSRGQTILI